MSSHKCDTALLGGQLDKPAYPSSVGSTAMATAPVTQQQLLQQQFLPQQQWQQQHPRSDQSLQQQQEEVKEWVFDDCSPPGDVSTLTLFSDHQQPLPADVHLDCLPPTVATECANDSPSPTDQQQLQPSRPSRINIPLPELEAHFHMTIEAAADALCVGLTAMKALCRKYKIARWPYRKLQRVRCLVGKLQAGVCKKREAEDMLSTLRELGLQDDSPAWLHLGIEAVSLRELCQLVLSSRVTRAPSSLYSSRAASKQLPASAAPAIAATLAKVDSLIEPAPAPALLPTSAAAGAFAVPSPKMATAARPTTAGINKAANGAAVMKMQPSSSCAPQLATDLPSHNIEPLRLSHDHAAASPSLGHYSQDGGNLPFSSSHTSSCEPLLMHAQCGDCILPAAADAAPHSRLANSLPMMLPELMRMPVADTMTLRSTPMQGLTREKLLHQQLARSSSGPGSLWQYSHYETLALVPASAPLMSAASAMHQPMPVAMSGPQQHELVPAPSGGLPFTAAQWQQLQHLQQQEQLLQQQQQELAALRLALQHSQQHAMQQMQAMSQMRAMQQQQRQQRGAPAVQQQQQPHGAPAVQQQEALGPVFVPDLHQLLPDGGHSPQQQYEEDNLFGPFSLFDFPSLSTQSAAATACMQATSKAPTQMMMGSTAAGPAGGDAAWAPPLHAARSAALPPAVVAPQRQQQVPGIESPALPPPSHLPPKWARQATCEPPPLQINPLEQQVCGPNRPMAMRPWACAPSSADGGSAVLCPPVGWATAGPPVVVPGPAGSWGEPQPDAACRLDSLP